MVDEMLVAQAQWLPQYTEAIEAAKKNLAEGPLLPTKEGYEGVARLKVKTVEEMALEAEKNRALAGAAAKENVK